jgi:hypothetical protein
MRRWLLLPLLLLSSLLAWGCGDSGGEEAVNVMEPKPSFEVSDGTFAVAANIIFDTCDSDSIFDGEYEMQFDGNTFTMGNRWEGTWNATTLSGNGESEHESYTVRFCTVTTWTSVMFTFDSEDEFAGTVTFRQRVNGDCREPCVTTWTISGQRQPGPSAIR